MSALAKVGLVVAVLGVAWAGGKLLRAKPWFRAGCDCGKGRCSR